MKTLNKINLLCSALMLGFMAVTGVPAYAQSNDLPMHMDKKALKADMADQCEALMAKYEKFVADTKAEDAALTAQVKAMNNAPQEQKTALLAAIVTQLVENTTASHARMSAMQAEMMPHMRAHMSAGVDSTSACPMMKGMSHASADHQKHMPSPGDNRDLQP